ncbi:ABC transporter permease [Anoxynatronum buryatiense]|uniref:Lipoprotein-releasing system permease protein n=1 Tax=Anoxynatronum buryatiense TaxID=489973 RepID=A0AA46AJ10_9CLOT|nr:FtsX-like permease family protein [Anoxynatronum buryatiense]SMP56154.1 lipoprotein-releasing system permease protein [Anoxynatronum buryatiense]
MRFELKVALRFLREGKGQTLFILLGIAIGVAVQVFLGTLITGLQRDLINTTVGSSPHLIFSGSDASSLMPESFSSSDASDSSDSPGSPRHSGTATVTTAGNFRREDDTLKNWADLMALLDEDASLTAVSPVAQGNGFVLRSGQRWPVIVRGVEPERANAIYQLQAALQAGTMALEGNGLLMGSALAREARLTTGDQVTLELPGGGRQSFSVTGIFDLGSQSLNETWLFLDLGRAQRLLGLGDDISRIEVQMTDIFAADTLGAFYQQQLSGITVDNWKDQNADLLSGLQAQSSSSVTIQVFVLLAVTLGIASVLAVSVVQKSRQIGILKAMGTPSGSASRIFLFQGAFLGFGGALLGSGLGFVITQFFLWGTAQATGRPLFPLEFDPGYAAAIVVIATLASVISALLPARKSARLNPIEVIRG